MMWAFISHWPRNSFMIFLLQVQTCYGGHSDMTAKLITLQIPNSIELNTVTNTIQNSPFEKLIVTQLVKKFPTFYWNPNVNYYVHKWVKPHSFPLRCTLILSSYLCLGLLSGHLPSGFPIKILYIIIISTERAACPAYLILFDLIPLVLVEGYNYIIFSIILLLRFFFTHIFSSAPNEQKTFFFKIWSWVIVQSSIQMSWKYCLEL